MAVSLFGWFRVNASLFGQAAAELWTTLTGSALPEWVFIVAGGGLMTAGAALGVQSLKFLSVLLVPVQLPVLLWLAKITLTGTGFTELLRIEPVGGYDVGEFVISSFDDQQQMTINVQNEYLIAIVNGQCVATVPDLICVLDRERLLPITSERLSYGLRIGVIGIPAPALYKTPEAMTSTEPRAFGFDIDYAEMVAR